MNILNARRQQPSQPYNKKPTGTIDQFLKSKSVIQRKKSESMMFWSRYKSLREVRR